MQEEVFEKAYQSLNSAQKEAVDTIEGPVMVVAGPGTGKTTILTLRIATILKETDTRPENILALTFTESGARAMRERLLTHIGAAAYRVIIATFHEFAGNLIRLYPDAYERVVGGRPATDIEKVELLETLLENSNIKLLHPIGGPLFYVPYVGKAVATMKQEYIAPDSFAKIINEQEKELATIPKIHEKGAHKGKVRSVYQKKERSIAKNRELLLIYREYEALMQERRLYDYEDMIVETVRMLETNEDVLLDLQEQYQYILADEHQDVNGSQNRILELLASYHKSPNLFVVGDEKQAIFRFQGASLENFLYFEDTFKNTKTIALTQNYRSGQEILDTAHSLIEVDEGPARELRIPLMAVRKHVSTVERRSFSHQAVEDDWLVRTIASLIKKDTPPEEVAVIVRTNREVEAYAEKLRKAGIAASASADGNILLHPVTISVQMLIDACVMPEDEYALSSVLHGSYWGIDADDLVRVLRARSYERPLSSILKDKKLLRSLKVAHVGEVHRIVDVLETARKMESTEAPHRILEYLLSESGFLKEIMENDPLEGIRVVRRLYDEVEEMVIRDGVRTLYDVGAALKRRKEHALPLIAPYTMTDIHSVRVMTAHKAKGLEFAHVFIPHLTDSLWGGGRRPEYFDIPLMRHLKNAAFDVLDDERRLLYVAITRAKDGLYLSSADTSIEGRELVPSRLFEDIKEGLLTEKDTRKEEQNFDPAAGLTAKKSSPPIDAELCRMLLAERGLSATALNNYLRSPWDYFYRNMLRIPEVQSLYLQKGTVLHNVLRSVTAYHTQEAKLPSDSEVGRYLERELRRLPITEEEYVRLHEDGFSALLGYVHHVGPELPKKTKEELKLEVMLPTGDTDLPDVKLTGILDRLDFDEAGKVVRIIDYKSGRPRTRGYIEGNTKDSDGNYKRQLVFYALLLSLYEDEHYQCKKGLIAFIEPDARGNIKEELYAITDEEIDALKEEILRVAREIRTGAFLSMPCDPAVSAYCDLARMLSY